MSSDNQRTVVVRRHDSDGKIHLREYENIFKLFVLKGGALMLVSEDNNRVFLSPKHIMDFTAEAAVDIDMTALG